MNYLYSDYEFSVIGFKTLYGFRMPFGSIIFFRSYIISISEELLLR